MSTALRPALGGLLLALLAGCDLAERGDPAREVLQRVNGARSNARACGETRYAATHALAWEDRLAAAAARHSRDLATHGRASHTGSDGSTPTSRIAEAGYPAAVLGEAVAVGSADPGTVVDGWLRSPPHCRVLMDPRVTEVGIAAAGGRYWTLDVAAPGLLAPTAIASR